MQIKSVEIYFKVHRGLRSFMVWAIGERRVFLGSIFADEVGDPQEQSHKLNFLYNRGKTIGMHIKMVKRGNNFYCAKPQWYFPKFTIIIEEAKKAEVFFPPYVPPVSEKENWWDK